MTPNRIYIKDQSAIPLGMQGDGNVREIVFTPPEGLADKAWTASHQRATDPEPYPVALRAKDGDLIWIVSAADTDIAGQGRLQLVCLDGEDQVLKTMVYRTHVSASLSAPGDAPDPVKPWYDELMRELADIGDIPPEEIEQAVQDYLAEHPITETDPTVPAWAKQPEKPTYTAEEVGALSADTLQAATDAALAQAKESGEFDGPKGDKGDPGPAGEDGYTPVKGEDYYTEADKQEIVDDVLEQIPAGGGDITLGLTGATVGQIAKITAVDAEGKPTAWEPVDMAGGGASNQFRLLRTVTIPEDITADISGVSFSEKSGGGITFAFDTDDDGNPFAVHELIIKSQNAGTPHSRSAFSLDLSHATPVYVSKAIIINLSIGVSGNTARSEAYVALHSNGMCTTWGATFGGGSNNAVTNPVTVPLDKGVYVITQINCLMNNLADYGFSAGSTFYFFGR